MNDCLIDNPTEYISLNDPVKLFKTVKFYVKSDLKDGYVLHLSQLRTQVYTLGPKEYFIDIAEHFGKSNPSSYSATMRRLGSSSSRVVNRFNLIHTFTTVLGSYFNDAFDGATT